MRRLEAKEEQINASAAQLQGRIDGFLAAGCGEQGDTATPTCEQIVQRMRQSDWLLDRYARDTAASMEYAAQRDARLVKEACDGWGTDEKKLIGVICALPKGQLMRVNAVYAENYGKSLAEVVDDELGGVFEGNLNYFMKVLLTPRADFDAGLLKEAMDGWGTDDMALLCEVVGTRTNEELAAAKAEFPAVVGGDDDALEAWLGGDTSGDYKDFLLVCMKATRSSAPADARRAAEQAAALKGALEGWGQNNEQDAVRDIVANASPAQMLAIHAPGGSTDVAPGWMVKEATEHSKSEWLRSDRVAKERGRGRGRGSPTPGGGGSPTPAR